MIHFKHPKQISTWLLVIMMSATITAHANNSTINSAEQLTTHITTAIKQTIVKSTDNDRLYQDPSQQADDEIVGVRSFDDSFSDCQNQFTNRQAPTLIGEQGERLSAMARALCFEGFATLHSGIARTPLWSASHLTQARISQARTLARVDSFRAESRLPADERAELSDYRRSGYDRGHIAPNGDMATTESQYGSFSLANIAPQNGEHNRHLWRHIETQTRQLAIEYGEVYVVTGVAFLGKTSERIGGRVLVPSHFFKAVYIPKLSAAGVYFSSNDSSENYQIISLDELTRLTGINAMPSLPTQIRQTAYDLPKPISNKNPEQKVLGDQPSSWFDLVISAMRYVFETLNRA